MVLVLLWVRFGLRCSYGCFNKLSVVVGTTTGNEGCFFFVITVMVDIVVINIIHVIIPWRKQFQCGLCANVFSYLLFL